MTDSQSCNSVAHNLTIEQKEYAAKVLNESDENRENAIAVIKRSIQENDLRARTKIAKIMIMLTRYFLNDKLKQKLHIYTRKTTHDCFKNIPANILPAEYGGTDAYWKKAIEGNRDWIVDDEKYKPIS